MLGLTATLDSPQTVSGSGAGSVAEPSQHAANSPCSVTHSATSRAARWGLTRLEARRPSGQLMSHATSRSADHCRGTDPVCTSTVVGRGSDRHVHLPVLPPPLQPPDRVPGPSPTGVP